MKQVKRLSFLVEVDQPGDSQVYSNEENADGIAEVLTTEKALTIPVHVEYRGYKLVSVS